MEKRVSNKFHNVLNFTNSVIAKFIQSYMDMFGYFCYASKYLHIGCRGPPDQFEILKFKLNGGKKDGRTPKKKKT